VISRTIIENNNLINSGYLIMSYRSLSIEECTIQRSANHFILFEETVNVSSSSADDVVIFGYGNLRVYNSNISNSSISANYFESQESNFTSTLFVTTSTTVFNSSQLIDSKLLWYGRKAMVSITMIVNTSMVIAFGQMTFKNSQIYPYKVQAILAYRNDRD